MKVNHRQTTGPKTQSRSTTDTHFFLVWPSLECVFSLLTHGRPSHWLPRGNMTLESPGTDSLRFKTFKDPSCETQSFQNCPALTEHLTRPKHWELQFYVDCRMTMKFLRLPFLKSSPMCVNGKRFIFQTCTVSLVSQARKPYIAVIVCITK